MKKRKGFTLVEIMIVVAIIALLAAIAIPSLLRARMSANEAAAIGATRALVTAAHSFRAANNAYPALIGSLTVAPSYLDAVLGTGTKQGYTYVVTGSTNTFTVTGAPVTPNTTGNRYFFADESGVIRANPGAAATVGSEPIGG